MQVQKKADILSGLFDFHGCKHNLAIDAKRPPRLVITPRR